jgi:hypothetical protein
MINPLIRAALILACPICAAAKGRQCEDVQGGFVVTRPTPHIYRIQVGLEELPLPDRMRATAGLLDEIGEFYGGAK